MRGKQLVFLYSWFYLPVTQSIVAQATHFQKAGAQCSQQVMLALLLGCQSTGLGFQSELLGLGLCPQLAQLPQRAQAWGTLGSGTCEPHRDSLVHSLEGLDQF